MQFSSAQNLEALCPLRHKGLGALIITHALVNNEYLYNNGRNNVLNKYTNRTFRSEVGSEVYIDSGILLDYWMETGEDSPQHQLLQRCKHTIETLHQELIHLQINNELLVSETEGMKKVLAEKDMVIYELQGRINAMQMDEGAGDESYRQQSIGEREELFGRYLKVVADNN